MSRVLTIRPRPVGPGRDQHDPPQGDFFQKKIESDLTRSNSQQLGGI
jgi:hypothetical protein